MTASDRPEMYDVATRDRIRRKLRHHLTEHRIGVPRLAERIEQASPNKPEIPIKTLQRFLAASHRTNDMYVRFFDQFAKGLPDADPIGELGRAMAAFHDAQDAGDFGGDYTSVMSRDNRGEYRSSLNIIADNTFCRVVERSNDGRLVIYDGVLIGSNKTAVIALQDRTTKAPKQYLIGAAKEGYAARGTEAGFTSSIGPTVHTLSGWLAAGGSKPESPASFLEPTRPSERMPPVNSRPGMPDLAAPAIDPLNVPAFRVYSANRTNAPADRSERSTLFKWLAARFRRSPEAQPPKVPGAHTSAIESGPLDILNQLIPEHPKMYTPDQLQEAFLVAADEANEAELIRLVEEGADINKPDPATGLTALHLSVGRDAIGPARYLVGLGAAFVPDKFGRMPSTIAVESEVSDEVANFIIEAEAAAECV